MPIRLHLAVVLFRVLLDFTVFNLWRQSYGFLQNSTARPLALGIQWVKIQFRTSRRYFLYEQLFFKISAILLRPHKPKIPHVNSITTLPENISVDAIAEIVVPDIRDVLRRKLSNKLGRILRLMKLIGAYYGDTTLNEESQVNSNFCSRFYCTFVALGQWTPVFLVLTSLFYEGLENMPNFYWLLIAGIWCLQNAIVTTLCLCVFPKRGNKAFSSIFSPFHRLFIDF